VACRAGFLLCLPLAAALLLRVLFIWALVVLAGAAVVRVRVSALAVALLAGEPALALERPGDAVAGELVGDVPPHDQAGVAVGAAVERRERLGLLEVLALEADRKPARLLLEQLAELLELLAGLVVEREAAKRVAGAGPVDVGGQVVRIAAIAAQDNPDRVARQVRPRARLVPFVRPFGVDPGGCDRRQLRVQLGQCGERLDRAGRDFAGCHRGVQLGGELEHLQPVGHPLLRHAELLGHAPAGQAAFLDQPLVGARLFYRVEVLAHHVLDHGQVEPVRCARIAHEHRHLLEPGRLGGPVAALAGHEPVAVAVDADDARLQHAVGGDRAGQPLELCAVESVARVEPLGDLDLCQRDGALLCLRDGLGGHVHLLLDQGPARCGPRQPRPRTRRVRSWPGGRVPVAGAHNRGSFPDLSVAAVPATSSERLPAARSRRHSSKRGRPTRFRPCGRARPLSAEG
jgi:hypothetical protein